MELPAENSTTGDQTTAYAYNGRGLQTHVTYEETGVVTLAYDSAGHMTKRTDEAGIAVDYFYDPAGRLTKRQKSGATTDIEQYAYDGLGRLITAKKGSSGDDDDVSRSIFAFDSLSRLLSESQSIYGNTAKTVYSAYDKGGNRTQLIYHDDLVTSAYGYDSRDRCTTIDKDGTSLASYRWLDGLMDRRDVTSEYTYALAAGTHRPGFKTEFQRDGILRITTAVNELTVSDQAHATLVARKRLGSWDYSYDTASNLTAENQNPSMGFLDSTRSYAYDDLYRVNTAHLKDTQDWSSATQQTTDFQYDTLSNRISHSYRDTSAIGYSHDKANRMTTLAGNAQDYDLRGNQTKGYPAAGSGQYQYSYDHHNRLTRIDTLAGFPSDRAQFAYDALGRRILADLTASDPDDGISYYYDGASEIVEWIGDDPDPDPFGVTLTPEALRYYIHGVSYLDERLMMYDFTPGPLLGYKPYYFTLDRQYNVRGIVDRAGALCEVYRYDEYGRLRIRESLGRGDQRVDSIFGPGDSNDFNNTLAGTVWDPRADIDDDGDVDNADSTARAVKVANWYPVVTPTVSQATSDFGNPFGWQGRPHYAIDTAPGATDGKLMLIDHRLRMHDPVTGRWLTRDPIGYMGGTFNLYEYLKSNALKYVDPEGTRILIGDAEGTCSGRIGPWKDGKTIAIIDIFADGWLWDELLETYGFVIHEDMRDSRDIRTRVWIEFEGVQFLVVLDDLREWLETVLPGELADPDVIIATTPEFLKGMIFKSFLDNLGDELIGVMITSTREYLPGFDPYDPYNISQSGDSITEVLQQAALMAKDGILDTMVGLLTIAGITTIGASSQLVGMVDDIAGGRPRRIGGKPVPKPAEPPPGVQRVSNPKHHINSASPEPPNVQELFDNAIVANNGTRWAKDSDGVIHRFSAPRNGQSHWNGSTAGASGIRWENIPPEIRGSLK